jgi:hypothetical protein
MLDETRMKLMECRHLHCFLAKTSRLTVWCFEDEDLLKFTNKYRIQSKPTLQPIRYDEIVIQHSSHIIYKHYKSLTFLPIRTVYVDR